MESQLFPIDVSEWTWETIESLRENEQEENRYLEYKSHLQYPEDENEKSKTEWRHNIEAEITAFANANGGILLFGVGDDRTPIGIERPQHDVARSVNQFIQNSTPVPHVEVSTVDLPGNGPDRIFVVVRIYEAPRKPVTTSKSALYLRVTESKIPMPREQIESMFVETDRRQQAIRLLEMEVERFLDTYEHTFRNYPIIEEAPDFHLIDQQALYDVFRENVHVYSDERASSIIRSVFSKLRDIDSQERYYGRLVSGTTLNPYDGYDSMNRTERRDLKKHAGRLNELIEQLIETLDLDVEQV